MTDLARGLEELIAKWRKKYPGCPPYNHSNEYWAGQCFGVNRCADELAAVMASASPQPEGWRGISQEPTEEQTVNGIRHKVYASRRISDDSLHLSTFEGEALTPTLTRKEAYRLACDIIELFQFPALSPRTP